MNILYFSTAEIPSHFANSVNVMKMCAALSKSNNVELVCLKSKNTEDDPFTYYGVSSDFSLQFVVNDKLGVIRRIVALFKYAKKADVIYTRYTIAAFLATVFMDKKIIYEYHAYATGLNGIIEKILQHSKKVIHVFITHALKESYCKNRNYLQCQKVIVLPDAADPISINIEDNKRENLKVGYTGSFQKGKGVDMVVEIANHMPNTEFSIVGGNPDEISELKKRQHYENIQWFGFVSQSEAMNILKDNIDIALLPNQDKVLVGKRGNVNIGSCTSPMKLFEYMACGKAIIASDIPVLKEILRNNYNSLLVPATSVQSWIDAINEVQHNKVLFNELRKNANKDFYDNYTWERRANRIIDFAFANEKRS